MTDYYENALKAINEMFSNLAVSREDTIINLRALIEEIEMMLESLDETV